MFETQKLVNHFPKDSLMRKDPSSFGFRFFSIFGELSQNFVRDLINFKNSYYPLTYNNDSLSTAYSWDIGDFGFTFTDLSNNSVFKVPSAYGDSAQLEYAKDDVTFINSLPSALKFIQSFSGAEYVVYESDLNDSSSINDFDFPSKLFIEFSGVSSFSISDDSDNALARQKNASLHLIGEDFYGNEIDEYISPSVNGVYITKYFYSKLLDFTLINISSDGNIKIKCLDFNLLEYISESFLAITPEINTLLVKDFDEDFFILKYYIFPPENGKRISDEKETLAEYKLLDSEGNYLTIEDITFSKSLEDLYVLSSGKLYIYRNWLDSLLFNAPAQERTLEVLMSASFMYSHIGLNKVNVCYINQNLLNKKVDNYQIILIDPNNNRFYLNSDYEFDSDIYYFQNNYYTENVNYVPDFSFEFALDTIGQWELNIVAVDTDGNEYIFVSNVMCPYLEPDKEITLTKNYTAISYSYDGYLYLKYNDEIDRYKTINNTYFIDFTNKILYTTETFSNLEVIYE